MGEIIKEILTLMVVEHIRVRKSNSKAIDGTFTIPPGAHVWVSIAQTLGIGDDIDWGFASSNSFIGITVWAFTGANYATWDSTGSAPGYLLSNGNYITATGTFDVPIKDRNWHIVFFNGDGDYQSSSVYITVVDYDQTAPTVSILSSSNDDTVSGAITIIAIASDANGVTCVQYKINSGSWSSCEGLVRGWFSMPWDTTGVANGAHTISVRAADGSAYSPYGYASALTVTVNNVVLDTTNPSVSISSPSNGATVSGTTTISVSASDNVGVSYTRYRIDGGTWTTDSTSPYSWSWDTTGVSNGDHTILVEAYDAAGNFASTSLSVTVNNVVADGINPSVSISSPLNGATVSGTTSISVSASDNVGVSYTRYRIDSGTWTTDSTSPYSWSWDTTGVSNGAHTINVEAYDAAGNFASTSLSIMVNNPIADTTTPTTSTEVSTSGNVEVTTTTNTGNGQGSTTVTTSTTTGTTASSNGVPLATESKETSDDDETTAETQQTPSAPASIFNAWLVFWSLFVAVRIRGRLSK
ncbi:MAG: hypothetical protein IH840_10585 [Candidatus Heimdallarchaeota archaeon]|nr:hypothetical protein [Candidatus Heimdallarchaeota archaeon]